MTTAMPPRETWHEQALCRNEDPELFFPETRGRPTKATKELFYAQEICSRCPVAQQCLQYALRNHCDYGIWGGLNEDQRYEMRRKGTA